MLITRGGKEETVIPFNCLFYYMIISYYYIIILCICFVSLNCRSSQCPMIMRWLINRNGFLNEKGSIPLCRIWCWCQDNVWLHIQICANKGKGNTLFIGVNGNKISVKTLQNHLLTSAHINCEKALDVQVSPKNVPLPSCLQRMDKDIKEKHLKLFNIAHYVVKEEEPFTKCPILVDLHFKNGLDLCNTYKNDHACNTFIGNIIQTISDDLEDKIKSARFFFIMSDASVDWSMQDQEIIYITGYLLHGDTAACQQSRHPGRHHYWS